MEYGIYNLPLKNNNKRAAFVTRKVIKNNEPNVFTLLQKGAIVTRELKELLLLPHNLGH